MDTRIPVFGATTIAEWFGFFCLDLAPLISEVWGEGGGGGAVVCGVRVDKAVWLR